MFPDFAFWSEYPRRKTFYSSQQCSELPLMDISEAVFENSNAFIAGKTPLDLTQSYDPPQLSKDIVTTIVLYDGTSQAWLRSCGPTQGGGGLVRLIV